MIEKLKGSLRNRYDYFSFRSKTLRLGWEERKNKTSDDSLPVPSPLLRFRVHGGFELDTYLLVGKNCARNIKDLLGTVGKDFYSFNKVLDFGCGSGRVMRFLRDGPDSCHLYGTDIDRQAISWCRRHLPFATWYTNKALPPTAYPNDTFDFIYAISVFTHIDEEMQFAWLKELKRISKPGGILILTVHGEFAGSGFSDETKAFISKNGFYYSVQPTGMFEFAGMPDFYQVTYHSRAYVEDKWSEHFKILRYVERGVNGHQDAVILQNE